MRRGEQMGNKSKKSGIKAKSKTSKRPATGIKSGPFQRLQEKWREQGKCGHGKRIAKHYKNFNNHGAFIWAGRGCAECVGFLKPRGFMCVETDHESLEKDLRDSVNRKKKHGYGHPPDGVGSSAFSDAVEHELDEDNEIEVGSDNDKAFNFNGFEAAIAKGRKLGIGDYSTLADYVASERNKPWRDPGRKLDELEVLEGVVDLLSNLEREGALDRVMRYLVSRYMPG